MTENKQKIGHQAMEVATKVATWLTIAVLGFFTTTLLSLDRNYGIMSSVVESGFESMGEKLERIEKKQDENSRLIVQHEARLATIEATRFTDDDARVLLMSFFERMAALDSKIHDLWEAISGMKSEIPDRANK